MATANREESVTVQVVLRMTEIEARFLLSWIDDNKPVGTLDGPVTAALRVVLADRHI